MRVATSLVAAVLAVLAVAPQATSTTAAPAPFCAGTTTGPRASCLVSCQVFSPGGSFVAVTGEGVTADYAVDARVGITGCGASYSCALLYVATYGPVARACGWYVNYASSGYLTCWGEEYVGTFNCGETPL